MTRCLFSFEAWEKRAWLLARANRDVHLLKDPTALVREDGTGRHNFAAGSALQNIFVGVEDDFFGLAIQNKIGLSRGISGHG
jgi:hypothetical protein